MEPSDPFIQFIELAGWPKSLDLIGRQRLLSLWTFSCQPATELRASVFGKLTSVLSSQEAQDWGEKEWMDVVLAIRSGSADEKGQLAEVMCQRFVNRRPQVLDRLMTALYKPDVNVNSVNNSRAFETPNGSSSFRLEAEEDNCTTAPDSTFNATGEKNFEVIASTSQTAAASDAHMDSNSFPTTRARRSVSRSSCNKRNILEEEDAHVSGRNKKSLRLQLKTYSGVVQLSVSDIQGTSKRLEDDGCIQVDTKKWEAILKGCQPSAKIILPEGSFSFPPKYNLRPNRPGVTISITSPEKTTICYHPLNLQSKPKKPTYAVIISLWNELTFENLTVKAKFPQENTWPRIVISGDKCQVQNVTFHECGLEIGTCRNVVDNLKFFGKGESTEVPSLPTKDVSEGILIATPAGSGNVVKNVYIQDVFFGIWKVNMDPRLKPKPGMTDWIENVTCRNVKFGVNFKMCWGVTVKHLTWQWDWKVKEEARTEVPAAVQIHGGQDNVVSGITCQGNGKHFYGFVLNDEADSGVPRRNKVSGLKGAYGRYWDNGEENELFDVKG